MRTVLSFVFTTFIIIGSSAQSLRIGAVFQPDLTYFTVSPDGSSLASDFKLLNKPTINYQTGILAFYDISDKLTLVGGLTYSRRGFEAQFNTSTISGFNFGSGSLPNLLDSDWSFSALAFISSFLFFFLHFCQEFFLHKQVA